MISNPTPPESSRRCHGRTKRKPSQANHDEFVLLIPAIRRQILAQFRKKTPEEKAELVNACLDKAYRAYVCLIEFNLQDIVYPAVLARHAVKQVQYGHDVGVSHNVQPRDARHPKTANAPGAVVEVLKKAGKPRHWHLNEMRAKLQGGSGYRRAALSRRGNSAENRRKNYKVKKAVLKNRWHWRKQNRLSVKVIRQCGRR